MYVSTGIRKADRSMRVDLDEVGSGSVTVAGLAQGLQSTFGLKEDGVRYTEYEWA